MLSYVCLYRIESIMFCLDAPFGFQCWADDTDHAEEQCLNAYPDCSVVWVWHGEKFADALDDYYQMET